MSKKLSKKLKSQKNNKKSYFKNLSFVDDGECQKNIINYDSIFLRFQKLIYRAFFGYLYISIESP